MWWPLWPALLSFHCFGCYGFMYATKQILIWYLLTWQILTKVRILSIHLSSHQVIVWLGLQWIRWLGKCLTGTVDAFSLDHGTQCEIIKYLCFVNSRSLVVMFAAIRLQGPRFKPRPGKKFETRFLFHAQPCSASWTTTSGTRASLKPGNSPKKWISEGLTDGCRYISRKEETQMKFNGG